ncbi:cold-shock protein [Sphaerisporangium perillae]|uniref:cold-shock protein n=1 Tax=Sphaerisporangium perillae TaxID=2935860 RepID=UPI00200FE22E|nr:cold shock domain-containing protein [Sphaerisporangium perillae]
MSEEPVEVATGTVVEWSDDEGWGFLRSADVPGDIFAHFSMITGVQGYRTLAPGQRVRFTWERARQDGFDFRAIDVFVGDDLTPGTPDEVDDSLGGGAYESHLRIQFDPPSE